MIIITAKIKQDNVNVLLIIIIIVITLIIIIIIITIVIVIKLYCMTIALRGNYRLVEKNSQKSDA